MAQHGKKDMGVQSRVQYRLGGNIGLFCCHGNNNCYLTRLLTTVDSPSDEVINMAEALYNEQFQETPEEPENGREGQ